MFQKNGWCVAARDHEVTREPAGGIHIRNLDAPTPETETSTFYFYGHTRDFAVGDKTTSDLLFEQFGKTFDEDVDILEAQQRSPARDPERALVDIYVDAPGLASRRMVEARIAAERGAA